METETTINVPTTELVPRPLPKTIELFKSAWNLFKTRASNLLTISFISIFATALPVFVLDQFGMPQGEASVEFLLITLGTLLLFAVGVYLALWGQIAMIWIIKHQDDELTIKEAYSQSHSKICSYLWVMILSVLITMIGMILLIIPGIIISVWFSLAIFIVLNGEEKGLNALLKSKEYVRGHWWQFFKYILFVAGISLLVALVGAIVEFVSTEYAAEMARNLFSIFMTPFFLAYSYCMYLAAKDQKPSLNFVVNPNHRKLLIGVVIFGFIIPFAIIYAVGAFLLSDKYTQQKTPTTVSEESVSVE